MLAIRHTNNGDVIPCVNWSKKKKMFKASILNARQINRVEIVNGFEANTHSLGLRINGFCDCDVGDNIQVLGVIYKIDSKLETPNTKLAKFRTDYQNFNGTTDVILKR